jgi:hypothetical protein
MLPLNWSGLRRQDHPLLVVAAPGIPRGGCAAHMSYIPSSIDLCQDILFFVPTSSCEFFSGSRPQVCEDMLTSGSALRRNSTGCADTRRREGRLPRNHFEVVIVGSGIVGSALARLVAQGAPTASVLMVEAGSEPVHATAVPEAVNSPVGMLIRHATEWGVVSDVPTFRSTTDAVRDRQPVELTEAMPGLAANTGIGGMGPYWAHACPPPTLDERPSWLASDAWGVAVTTAEDTLSVTADIYGHLAASNDLHSLLRSPWPTARPMPIAGTVDEAGDRGRLADRFLARAGQRDVTLRHSLSCRATARGSSCLGRARPSQHEGYRGR